MFALISLANKSQWIAVRVRERLRSLGMLHHSETWIEGEGRGTLTFSAASAQALSKKKNKKKKEEAEGKQTKTQPNGSLTTLPGNRVEMEWGEGRDRAGTRRPKHSRCAPAEWNMSTWLSATLCTVRVCWFIFHLDEQDRWITKRPFTQGWPYFQLSNPFI